MIAVASFLLLPPRSNSLCNSARLCNSRIACLTQALLLQHGGLLSMPSPPGGPRTKSTRTNSQAARTIRDAKLAGNRCTRCYSACSTLPWLYSTRILGEGWWRYETE
ncbi:hypothetical protein FB45DRAFT_889543, partial [Roridomyces roridus]